jgi:hypothetical protein
VALGDGTEAQAEITLSQRDTPGFVVQFAPSGRPGGSLAGGLRQLGEGEAIGTMGATYQRDRDEITFATLDGRGLARQPVVATRIGPRPVPTPSAPTPAPLPSAPPPPVGPLPPTTPPAGPAPTGPIPQLPAPAPIGGVSALQQIDTFAVALRDAVVVGDGGVDVTLDIRNVGEDAQPITGSLFHVMMVDADGLGTETVAPLMPGDGPPRAFDERPVLAPGGQMEARFRLTPFTGGAPIVRLSVAVHLDQAASFPLANLASPLLSAEGPPAGGGGAFAALTDFEVRIDRIVAAGGATELFFTIRNPTDRRIQVSDTAFTFRAADRHGAAKESARDFYPARGARSAGPLHSSVFIEPGGEARLRTIFAGAIQGPVTVTDWTVSHTIN